MRRSPLLQRLYRHRTMSVLQRQVAAPLSRSVTNRTEPLVQAIWLPNAAVQRIVLEENRPVEPFASPVFQTVQERQEPTADSADSVPFLQRALQAVRERLPLPFRSTPTPQPATQRQAVPSSVLPTVPIVQPVTAQPTAAQAGIEPITRIATQPPFAQVVAPPAQPAKPTVQRSANLPPTTQSTLSPTYPSPPSTVDNVQRSVESSPSTQTESPTTPTLDSDWARLRAISELHKRKEQERTVQRSADVVSPQPTATIQREKPTQTVSQPVQRSSQPAESTPESPAPFVSSPAPTNRTLDDEWPRLRAISELHKQIAQRKAEAGATEPATIAREPVRPKITSPTEVLPFEVPPPRRPRPTVQKQSEPASVQKFDPSETEDEPVAAESPESPVPQASPSEVTAAEPVADTDAMSESVTDTIEEAQNVADEQPATAISGDATIGGNLTGANITVGGSVSAGGIVQAAQLTSGGDVMAGGVATIASGNVAGNVTTGGVASVQSATVGGNIESGGAAMLSGATQVGGDVTVGEAVLTSGATSIGGDVATGAAAQTSGATTVGGNLTSGGAVASAGSTIVGGNMMVGGSAAMSGSVNVGGNVNVAGSATGLPTEAGGEVQRMADPTLPQPRVSQSSNTMGEVQRSAESAQSTPTPMLPTPQSVQTSSESMAATPMQPIKREEAADNLAAPAPSQPALNEVWPIQRKSADTPVAKSPPIVPPARREDQTDAHVRSLLQRVEGGAASDSPIEFVTPRRPRPKTVQRKTVRPEKPKLDTPPSLVETEIGALPSDLWQLIGEQPPTAQVQKMDAADGVTASATTEFTDVSRQFDVSRLSDMPRDSVLTQAADSSLTTTKPNVVDESRAKSSPARTDISSPKNIVAPALAAEFNGETVTQRVDSPQTDVVSRMTTTDALRTERAARTIEAAQPTPMFPTMLTTPAPRPAMMTRTIESPPMETAVQVKTAPTTPSPAPIETPKPMATNGVVQTAIMSPEIVQREGEAASEAPSGDGEAPSEEGGEMDTDALAKAVYQQIKRQLSVEWERQYRR